MRPAKVRRVVWTDEARSNLAAQRFALKLVTTPETSSSLQSAEGLSDDNIATASIRAYLVRYRIEGETVFIPRIRHAARRPY